MDKLLKTLVFDNQISVSVLDTTEMVNKAIKTHNLSPLSAAALGRTLTIGTFMSSTLKNDKDKLSITINGDGVGGQIVVCGNKDLQMRGTIENERAELPLKENGKLDVGGCVGKNGRINIIKSMGLKDPYTGTSELINGEIAEDFTAYYFFSEQQPTAIALGVKIGVDLTCVGAGGVIVQTLPFASDEAIDKAEAIVKNLTNISTLIEENGAEKVLKDLFGDVEFNEYYPKYKCLCNRNYLKKILVSLGKEELLNIIKEEGEIKVNCEFCKKDYIFTLEDVEKLFK
ncbi:MAG: Hsp33 family molecular chaperone HslO [Clostridiales bacterium]|nr:Hsp33 family molecular chaperone HslO [Clostridiales bacterium]